jgi:hypothetical protein
MKRTLPYLFAFSILLFAQGCTKTVISSNGDVRGSDLIGSWVLTETADNNGAGWSYYNTGLEKGVFTFYGNRAARYEDGFSQMTGNWELLTLSAGYYDQYGQYHNDVHQSFRVHVDDMYTNNSVDLYFDDISVTNSNIIATSYNGHTVTRYIFTRY